MNQEIYEIVKFLSSPDGAGIPPEDVMPDRAREVLDALNEYENLMRDAEKWRREQNCAIMRDVDALRGQFPLLAKTARVRFLRQEMKENEELFAILRGAFIILIRNNMHYEANIIENIAEEIKEKIQKNKKILCSIKSGKEEITPYMIARAKQYPLENLLKINRKGFALCVAHQEKTPSMYCKDNFAFCFGCGFYGDAISLYRIISNASFVEAVRFLQG